MAVYTLTLADVRTRVEHKIRDDRSSDRVDDWINDVIQIMTSEVYFDELQSDGTDTITGDGVKQIFDLPEDFHAFIWMYDQDNNRLIEEVTPRQLVEEWSPFDVPVQAPVVYAPLGRTGAAGVNLVPLFQVKFDSVVTSALSLNYAYYKLHPKLENDTDIILLPVTLLNTIVDGVLLESDSWSDSDQFGMHRDRFLDKMNQLKKNQNRKPNLRRVFGPRVSGAKPAPPIFPPNYPGGRRL